jgi:1,2-phenylacetyl-CoA epoxidase PaaB subunit
MVVTVISYLLSGGVAGGLSYLIIEYQVKKDYQKTFQEQKEADQKYYHKIIRGKDEEIIVLDQELRSLKDSYECAKNEFVLRESALQVFGSNQNKIISNLREEIMELEQLCADKELEKTKLEVEHHRVVKNAVDEIDKLRAKVVGLSKNERTQKKNSLKKKK